MCTVACFHTLREFFSLSLKLRYFKCIASVNGMLVVAIGSEIPFMHSTPTGKKLGEKCDRKECEKEDVYIEM